MKLITYTVILMMGLIVIANAGDHLGDYLNDQVPEGYGHPLWLKIIAEYILRLLIVGTIFFSISDYPENRLLSGRGIMGITTALIVLGLSIRFHEVYNNILELGIKGIALFICGVLIIGFLRPILNGLQKFGRK